MRDIPEYYPTMYRDGYTPEEILQSQHHTMFQKIAARKADAEPLSVRMESEVKIK